MFWLVFKLLRVGVNQAKKRKNGGNQHEGWYDNGNREMQLTGPNDRSPAKNMLDSLLRFFQLVMGLTVVGLYGVDIHHAHEKGVSADAKWVYAEVTAVLAVITATVWLLAPFFMRNRSITTVRVLQLPAFAWEAVLVILWLTLFGIFGKMYIGEDPEGESGVTRMKHAVWVDLTNLIMWVGSATWCGLRWYKTPKPEPVESDKIYEQS